MTIVESFSVAVSVAAEELIDSQDLWIARLAKNLTHWLLLEPKTIPLPMELYRLDRRWAILQFLQVILPRAK